MPFETLTIVGVGLIGGSIGLAARRRQLARHILGAGRQQASLDRAMAVGAIDAGLLDASAAVHRADIAVFCTPVDQIVDQVLAAAPGCRPGTLLTDAGSTKAAIVQELEPRMPAGVAFVGSHPLAGSEKRGPDHADARLFEGRLTLVTRTPYTDPAALERTTGFWEALGARVLVIDPEEHDRAVAMTSHLPHLLAAALAGVLPPELRELTATGFRDTTRVAAGDPSLWMAIFVQNRAAVLEALRLVDGCLDQFRAALEAGDGQLVHALLTRAKKVRDALGS
jgi:prephenate dehydrogenase